MRRPPTLFLDVDGVLNRCGVSGQGLETAMVDQLRRVVTILNPRIVISSTWRLKEHQLDRLVRLCASIGAHLAGVTPDLSRSTTVGGIVLARPRHEEIQAWLDSNSPHGCFVILDDDAREMGPLLPHLVKTDSYVGLTVKEANQVITMLL